VIRVRHKIWDNSLLQDVVEEGTIMPGLVIPGKTIMTPHAMCDQRIQQQKTHAGCIMVHILGPDAGKIQIRIIFKDEHQQDEVVISTKVKDTRVTKTTTVETITTTLKASININSKIKANHRISIKIHNQILRHFPHGPCLLHVLC
jgi:hypothetical protein